MEIDKLKAFIEVSREKSFSKAADKLFISQSAVSKRISNLEEELQTRLFDRIGKRVELTETGERLFPEARQILFNIDNLKQTLTSDSKNVKGNLTMATSHHIGLHRLSPVLGKFNQLYPEARLDIRFMDSEKACESTLTGEIELAIVTLPQKPPAAIDTKILWVDNLKFVVNKAHPLTKFNKITNTDLLKYPAVLPAKETFTRRILETVIDKNQLKVNMETNYLETLKMLALTGLGWSIIPQTMLDPKLEILDINIKISRNLGSVTHKDRTLSNAAKAMLKLASNR